MLYVRQQLEHAPPGREVELQIGEVAFAQGTRLAIQLLVTAFRQHGKAHVARTQRCKGAAAAISHLRRPTQVDLRPDVELCSARQIVRCHPVLASRTEIAPPAHRAAVRSAVAADFAEIEATLERVMASFEVVDIDGSAPRAASVHSFDSLRTMLPKTGFAMVGVGRLQWVNAE